MGIEYKFLDLTFPSHDRSEKIEQILNEQAKDGWRLKSFHRNESKFSFILTRQVQEKTQKEKPHKAG